MLKRPLEGPRLGVYWHILQTASAAEIAFNRYVRLFPKSTWNELWAKKPNESDKTVFLTGHREVHFKSGHEFNNLRAETLHGAIIDECREQDPELWPMVIRPMLGRYKGWCDFYSTPNGFDWFYDLAKAAENDPEWDVICAPSTDAWWWDQAEIASAKRTMSEAQFAQEILAEFRDLISGRAYKNYGAHNKADHNPFWADGLIHPYLPINIGLDFNLNPMAWCLSQKKIGDFFFFDEIFLRGSHTQEAAKALAEKIVEYKHEKLGVILAGDATSKAGQRAAAGQSDYDIVCQTLDSYKIAWRNETPESNPTVKDRLNTVNAHLLDANGTPHIKILKGSCPELEKDFERVVVKPGASLVLDQTTDKERTHMSDGAGYKICALSPLKYDSALPTITVLRRSF